MARSYDIAILSQKVEWLEEALKNAGIELPEVTSSDNGKVLQVVDGAWATGNTINSNVVFTPVETVEKVRDTLTQNGDGVLGSLQLKLTNTANTWIEVGTFNKKPVDYSLFPIVNTTDGSYGGMGEINPTTGNVRLYTISALTAGSVSFNVTYKIAAAPTVTATSTRSRKKKEE